MAVDPDVLDGIRRGIRERRRLRFRYHDKDRIALPLRLGQDRGGQWFVRAMQVAGGSVTGVLGTAVPKLFRVARVQDLTVLDRRFTVPRDYEQVDHTIVAIDVELPRGGD